LLGWFSASPVLLVPFRMVKLVKVITWQTPVGVSEYSVAMAQSRVIRKLSFFMAIVEHGFVTNNRLLRYDFVNF